MYVPYLTNFFFLSFTRRFLCSRESPGHTCRSFVPLINMRRHPEARRAALTSSLLCMVRTPTPRKATLQEETFLRFPWNSSFFLSSTAYPAEVPLYRRALELGEVFISLISRRDWDGTLCAPGTNHTNRGIEDFGGSDDGCFFSFIWKTRRIFSNI